MKFIETRGNDGVKLDSVEFSDAILSPSASFGGLYIPKSLPKIDEKFISEVLNLSYKELSLKIIKMFDIDIDNQILKEAVDRYDSFDDSNNPIPLKKIDDKLFVNELFHGPTRAFKDMALLPFGHILSSLAKKRGENYLILAATSGDTGPATLHSFANEDNVKVVCLFPNGGTSDVQRLQMVTQEGDNLKSIAIKGSFDDAQTALKSLLSSKSFNEELKKRNISLSAANSVNFGRIIFQIIYHINAYLELIRQKELNYPDKFYSIIPSGNFGNALGAYYAKKMGLPIEKILIASNENNILTKLINNGEYDIRDLELLQTISPAMDILKSSNVERVLFDLFGAKRTKELMESLDKTNSYRLSEAEKKELQKYFSATFSIESQSKLAIKDSIENNNYVMDPHTATCIKAYNNLREKDLISVICSTAEWTKFAPTMANVINSDSKKYSDIEALKLFSTKLDIEIPSMIKELFEKEIKHKTIVEKEQIEEEILKFL